MRPLQVAIVGLACSLGGFAAAQQTTHVPLSTAEWNIQAREVLNKSGRTAARGLTVEVAKDGQGMRYFYSEANVLGGGSWTTVESWSEQSGRPVLAIYRAGGIAKRTRVVKFQFEADAVTVVDSERPKSNRRVEIPTDQQLVLSQFNPATLKGIESQGVDLLIFEPETCTATPHRVRFLGKEHVVSEGVTIGSMKRFELVSNSATSLIKTDLEDRFLNMENSLGQRMVLVEITPEEKQRAIGILRRALTSGSAQTARGSG